MKKEKKKPYFRNLLWLQVKAFNVHILGASVSHTGSEVVFVCSEHCSCAGVVLLSSFTQINYTVVYTHTDKTATNPD